MKAFLGVDGGNTKTLAVVADESGNILGSGRAGNGDIYGAVSPEAAMVAVESAIRDAKASAGTPDVHFAGYSIAGADWPEDYAYIGERLRPLSHQFDLVNDSYGALRAGTRDGVGVAVICGTYGTCGAGYGGKRWQGGFWHRAQGGAVPIGESAIDLVLDAELGIAPPTRLTRDLLSFYGEPTIEALLHRFSCRGGEGRTRLGALARLVFEAALANDAGAIGIVRSHGVRSGEYAIAAAAHVGLSGAFPLVLAGGALRHRPNPLEPVIVETVLERYPAAYPVAIRLEPVFGALMLAYDLAGVVVNERLEAQMMASQPDRTFFESLDRSPSSAP